VSYFSEDELRCQCGCGVYKFDPGMLEILNSIRKAVGSPLPVTSGYRCPDHPLEASKTASGAHSTGHAVDVGVRGEIALAVIREAQKAGIERIGVNQKGNGRFIHLDNAPDFPKPAIWTY